MLKASGIRHHARPVSLQTERSSESKRIWSSHLEEEARPSLSSELRRPGAGAGNCLAAGHPAAVMQTHSSRARKWRAVCRERTDGT